MQERVSQVSKIHPITHVYIATSLHIQYINERTRGRGAFARVWKLGTRRCSFSVFYLTWQQKRTSRICSNGF